LKFEVRKFKLENSNVDISWQQSKYDFQFRIILFAYNL